MATANENLKVADATYLYCEHNRAKSIMQDISIRI